MMKMNLVEIVMLREERERERPAGEVRRSRLAPPPASLSPKARIGPGSPPRGRGRSRLSARTCLEGEEIRGWERQGGDTMNRCWENRSWFVEPSDSKAEGSQSSLPAPAPAPSSETRGVYVQVWRLWDDPARVGSCQFVGIGFCGVRDSGCICGVYVPASSFSSCKAYLPSLPLRLRLRPALPAPSLPPFSSLSLPSSASASYIGVHLPI